MGTAYSHLMLQIFEWSFEARSGDGKVHFIHAQKVLWRNGVERLTLTLYGGDEVIRVSRGRYRIPRRTGTIDVTSDDPVAP